MNPNDEIRRTEALLEDLERLVSTMTLTAPQLRRLEGVVLPPLFQRLRVLRRAAGDWEQQAMTMLEQSERGWSRLAPSLPRTANVQNIADTITTLYEVATGWFSDYGWGPSLAAERRSRGAFIVFAAVAALWLAKGRR